MYIAISRTWSTYVFIYFLALSNLVKSDNNFIK